MAYVYTPITGYFYDKTIMWKENFRLDQCATNFKLKKSTSQLRPILVVEKYPDDNSDLYLFGLGTFFMYFKFSFPYWL